eukprot:1859266-Amphidinium_carterae.1
MATIESGLEHCVKFLAAGEKEKAHALHLHCEEFSTWLVGLATTSPDGDDIKAHTAKPCDGAF